MMLTKKNKKQYRILAPPRLMPFNNRNKVDDGATWISQEILLNSKRGEHRYRHRVRNCSISAPSPAMEICKSARPAPALIFGIVTTAIRYENDGPPTTSAATSTATS